MVSTSRTAGRCPVLAALVTTVAALGATPSCSHDSYLKVILQSGDGAFEGVTEVDVRVQGGNNGASAWLMYPASKPLSFDVAMPKTLSIAFTPSQSGTVSLEVGVRDVNGKCLGRGATTTTIKKGDVSAVPVLITRGGTCPVSADGGSPINDGGSDAVIFPGCDPASPATTCPANQTCFINCSTNRGMCVAAGTKGPGETCVTNNDCAPGSQCFDYTGIAGCSNGPKICQKFCNDDAQCAAQGPGTAGNGGGVAPPTGSGGTTGASGGAGGGGGTVSAGGGGGGAAGSGQGDAGGTAGGGAPASTGGATTPAAADGVATCRNPVVCSATVTTKYRTCSFACDPRGEAKLGCPTGLLCFLYRDLSTGQDAPDCGCRAPTRMGMDGAACTSSASCAPGHICNLMGNTQVCRKLCKMSAAADCTAPRVCSPLQNNAVFGVCVGS